MKTKKSLFEMNDNDKDVIADLLVAVRCLVRDGHKEVAEELVKRVMIGDD